MGNMDKADKDFLNPERVVTIWQLARLGMYGSGFITITLGGLIIANLFSLWVFIIISSFTIPIFIVTFFIWWILLEYPAVKSYAGLNSDEIYKYSF